MLYYIILKKIFPFRPFIHPPRGVQCQDQGCIKNIISITMTKMKMIMTKMRILTKIAIMTMTNM